MGKVLPSQVLSLRLQDEFVWSATSKGYRFWSEAHCNAQLLEWEGLIDSSFNKPDAPLLGMLYSMMEANEAMNTDYWQDVLDELQLEFKRMLDDLIEGNY